jgi:glycosyltransferase involved in cell wall biosynthesis
LWLLVSGDFTPLGGMDCANHGLASFLARRAGAEVHLVTHRAWPDLSALETMRVHTIARPWGKHMLGELLLRRAGRRAAAAIARRGGRVVVNGGNCLFGDINWVHYVHAAWTPRSGGRGGPGRLLKLKTGVFHRSALAAERASLKRARVIVANSERTRADLLERLDLAPERVHTVYYGIDPARFRPATDAERADARGRLRWAGDRPVVAFVGALGDLRKGLDTLLAAWRQLCADPGWDARLAVVGTGGMLARLRHQASDLGLGDSVAFLGFRADVPEILRACDLLVSPARYEAYGLNVHEALCCGLPAIASRSSGAAERYPEALAELLLPDPEDPSDLAARLQRWRAERERFATATATLSATLRTYTWDDMAARFVAVVEQGA